MLLTLFRRIWTKKHGIHDTAWTVGSRYTICCIPRLYWCNRKKVLNAFCSILHWWFSSLCSKNCEYRNDWRGFNLVRQLQLSVFVKPACFSASQSMLDQVPQRRTLGDCWYKIYRLDTQPTLSEHLMENLGENGKLILLQLYIFYDWFSCCISFVHKNGSECCFVFILIIVYDYYR